MDLSSSLSVANGDFAPKPTRLSFHSKWQTLVFRGVARIFQSGGHTVSNIIVMAFSPRNIVGCFLKKRLTKGGSRAPQEPPRYALGIGINAVPSRFVCEMVNDCNDSSFWRIVWNVTNLFVYASVIM